MITFKSVPYSQLHKWLLLGLFNFVIQVNGNSQTFLIPQIEVGYNTISNESDHFFSAGTFLEDREESFSIGLQLNQSFSNKFEVNLFSRFERLVARPDAIYALDSRGDDPIILLNDFNPRGIVFRRYHYGVGFGLELVKNLKVVSSFSMIHTASHKRQTKEDFRHALGELITKTGEFESNVELGLRYQLGSISIAAYYRYGFWQNINGEVYEIDPVNSMGIRVGYSFKLLDKIKRKRKVDCPEL